MVSPTHFLRIKEENESFESSRISNRLYLKEEAKKGLKKLEEKVLDTSPQHTLSESSEDSNTFAKLFRTREKYNFQPLYL